jgi:hypothetical protein
MRPAGDRRRRWLQLHAGAVALIGVMGSGIWLFAERGQAMNTAFWPGLLVVLLLVPLSLHAAIVFMTAPARPRPARDVPASVPVGQAGERALATVLPKALARHRYLQPDRLRDPVVLVTRKRL